MGSDDLEQIRGEAIMLNSLDHVHIVKLKEVRSANSILVDARLTEQTLLGHGAAVRRFASRPNSRGETQRSQEF